VDNLPTRSPYPEVLLLPKSKQCFIHEKGGDLEKYKFIKDVVFSTDENNSDAEECSARCSMYAIPLAQPTEKLALERSGYSTKGEDLVTRFTATRAASRRG
jgi:hypothetical protein